MYTPGCVYFSKPPRRQGYPTPPLPLSVIPYAPMVNPCRLTHRLTGLTHVPTTQTTGEAEKPERCGRPCRTGQRWGQTPERVGTTTTTAEAATATRTTADEVMPIIYRICPQNAREAPQKPRRAHRGKDSTTGHAEAPRRSCRRSW